MSTVETTDPSEEYVSTAINESGTTDSENLGGGSIPHSQSMADDEMPKMPSVPKRRMVITHDKYINLQTLLVLHLTEVERETGKGVDRDELIDWYLEQQEDNIRDIEELEYEKELITKVLKKLVKVRADVLPCPSMLFIDLQDNYLIQIMGDVQNSLPSLEESGEQESDVRVYYMVHPSVDTEGSSLSTS